MRSCSCRSGKSNCYASVVKKGHAFSCGPSVHQHRREPSVKDMIHKSVQMRKEARAQPYANTIKIGKDARSRHIQSNQRDLPIISSHARQCNRYRETFRPAEPKELEYLVDMEFFQYQDFLVADSEKSTARHLGLTIREQPDLLSTCKRDVLSSEGYFQVVRVNPRVYQE